MSRMKSSGFREYCPPSSLSEGGGLLEGKNGEGNWGSYILSREAELVQLHR